ncbi:hypothetical protein [Burkholderia cepacia]|uniref:hypothetical protein n=1 Tax=Burkholderia cepacia TaxID=292 RepID=UPI0026E111F0|nr:hypothetical protein [Burkholderia cepacia]MDO5943352.1 hypothetical protein [Burkholderia cepacia]
MNQHEKIKILARIRNYLFEKGERISLENIATIMGMSAHDVQRLFFEDGQPGTSLAKPDVDLDITPPQTPKKRTQGRGRKPAPYIEQLRGMDTANMTIAEIQALPIPGIDKPKPTSLYGTLRNNGIPVLGYSRTTVERLQQLNTEQYTLEELETMLGVSAKYIHRTMLAHKLKSKAQHEPMSAKLSTIEKIRVLQAQIIGMGHIPKISTIARALNMSRTEVENIMLKAGNDNSYGRDK